MTFLRSRYCLWSYLISKHQSVCMQNIIKLIRYATLTTETSQQHRQATLNRHTQSTTAGLIAGVRSHQSSSVNHPTSSGGNLMLSWQSTNRKTHNQLSVRSRGCIKISPREERQHLLCGVAVYVPTKLIAAK